MSDSPQNNLLATINSLKIYGVKLINGELERRHILEKFRKLARICECCGCVGVGEATWRTYQKLDSPSASWNEPGHIVVGCIHDNIFPELDTTREFVLLNSITTSGIPFKFLITWEDK